MMQTALTFVPLSDGVGIISGGGAHTCTLTANVGIKFWDSNNSGQLDNGINTDSTAAVDITGMVPPSLKRTNNAQ